MSKWIVWSKPAPLKVIALGALLAVIIGVPLTFLLLWLGLGQDLARILALIVAVIVALAYVKSRRPAATETRS